MCYDPPLVGDRERCIAAGMDGYCAKPISYGTLESLLSGHTHSQSPTAAAVTTPPSLSLL
jgi:CheY-like chemotaxis protein